jgi:hypothetical protein
VNCSVALPWMGRVMFELISRGIDDGLLRMTLRGDGGNGGFAVLDSQLRKIFVMFAILRGLL